MVSDVNHLWRCILVAILITQSALCISTTVQIDLIFPKNNTVYQPLYPFPIVFAVSNFSSAGQYKPVVRWVLSKLTLSKKERGVVADCIIGWDKDNSDPNFGAQPDKYLSIDSTIYISHDNGTSFPISWVLEYTVSVGRDRCFGTDSDRDLRGTMGEIFFDTSIKVGIIPDEKAFDPCPLNIGMIGITGQNQTDSVCPLLSSPRPAATCAFKVDSQTFDQISKTMVDTSKCKNVTWPGGTGIGNRCDPNKATAKSESSTLQWDSFHTVLLLTLLAITIII
jgi:hypothetical protein